jgi:hypothetical protein
MCLFWNLVLPLCILFRGVGAGAGAEAGAWSLELVRGLELPLPTYPQTDNLLCCTFFCTIFFFSIGTS